MVDRIVIVGGGLAGAKGAESMREQGFAGSIQLVAAESHVPYERPPLSKGYLLGNDEFAASQPHPAQWYEDNAVELLLGVRAVAVDRSASVVELSDGRQLHYDALLLATGSTPRQLDVPGAQAARYLRTKEDSDALRELFVEGARVVIIGGGWIGLETAAAAAQAGAQVTVAMREAAPLSPVLGDEIGEVFGALHRAHDVRLLGDVTAAAIELDGAGGARAVLLSDGTRIEADSVVIGVGAGPAIALAADAGLEIAEHGNGVLVDEGMRTSDPSIFAVGDIANAWHPVLQTRVRVEHWATALNQPAVAAANMLGGSAAYEDLPYFFSDQFDLGMEYVGYAPPGSFERVVVRGDLAGREFIAFWLDGAGRVLAGMNVNVWDVVDDVKALILAKSPVDPGALADPDAPLGSLAG